MHARSCFSALAPGLLFHLVLLGGCESAKDRLDAVRSLHEEGQFETSLEPLEELLAASPEDAELLYLYGLANARSGRASLALWPLRKAREHPDWAVIAGAALAQAALTTGDNGTAIEAASRVLEVEPEYRPMLAVRSEAYVRSGHFEEALVDAERFLELDPDALDAQVTRLRSFIGLERLDEAEELFAELEGRWSGEEFPELRGDRYCTAQALFAKESQQIELAEERFEACLEEFPTGRMVIQEAVVFYDEQGRRERATEILRAALELEPTAAQTREILARRLRNAGQVEEAAQLLLEGTELEPYVALQAWGGLAAHYFQLEDFAAAASAWERVLELSGEPEPDLLFGYAEALLRAGRHAQALEVAERLPQVYAELVRGLSLLEQGRPREALNHFDAGLRLWPNNAVARYYAAIAAERIGDFDRAVSEYRQSLRSGAELTDAGLRLARLHEAEGSHDPAWQAIALYAEARPQDVEGQLLALRIAARMRREDVVQRRLVALASPRGQRAAVVAQAAQIVALSQGPQAAVDFLTRAPEIDLVDPGDADALRVLAEQLLASGREDEARDRAETALTAHPEAAAFQEINGLVLERSGASGAMARAAYERAVELDPNHAPALAALGRLALQEGDDDLARSYYVKAAAHSEDIESRRRAAELAAAAGDREDAKQRLEALLDDMPYDGRAAASLALLLLEGGEAERAESLARRAMRFGGGREAYAALVEIGLAAGDPGRSAEVLSAVAARRPGDPSLHYQLGRALAAAGQPQAARAALRQALEVEAFPERTAAEAALASLGAKSEGG